MCNVLCYVYTTVQIEKFQTWLMNMKLDLFEMLNILLFPHKFGVQFRLNLNSKIFKYDDEDEEYLSCAQQII